MTEPFFEQVLSLPEQFGWAPKVENDVPALPGRLIIAGLGGSAMAGEFAAERLRPGRDVIVLREEFLPGWVRSDDEILCVSCSGNTSETVSIWKESSQRNLARRAVASGGELQALAEEEGKPFCQVPARFAPRASVGYLISAILAVSGSPLDEATRRDIQAHLKEAEAHWIGSGGDDSRSFTLAKALRHRLPIFVTWGEALQSVGARWVIDLAENAKEPGLHWAFPEANHNAVMVFAEEARAGHPLYLVQVGSLRDPRHVRRWETLQGLLQENEINVEPVRQHHDDVWIEGLGLVYISGLVTTALAEIEGVSASSLSLMDKLKARLS